jgi:hypothetical protein
MLNLEGLTLPVVNTADGTITLSFLVAAIAGALLLLLLLVSFLRAGATGLLALICVLAIGFGGAWLWTERERLEQRRALETRIMALDAQAVAPDSVLACIDGASGDAVDAGCERAVFASPEALAAVSSYVAARLSLVDDGFRLAGSDPEVERALDRSRRTLEQDRFGVVANVLAVRNGCSAERCDAFVLLRDSTRVRANLKDRTFDNTVGRFAAAWSARPARGGASSQAPTAPQPSAGVNFPSAASIPPVSIMNAEPPAPSAGAATEPPTAAAPPPARRPAPAARPPATQVRPLPPPGTATPPRP